MTNVTVRLPAGAVPPVYPDDAAPATVTVTGITLNVSQGGGGGSGSGVEIQQSSPSASWVISVPPGFGRRPNVAVYVAGELVEADVNANSSTVSVQFPVPTSGSIVLT